MTYLIHWAGVQQDVAICRFASKTDALVYSETMTQDRTAHAINDETDFTREAFSISSLGRLYNAWAEKPVAKFENRSVAIAKTWALMTSKFNNLPIVELNTPSANESTPMPAWTIKIVGKKIGITSFETEQAARAATPAEDPTLTIITSEFCLHSLTVEQLVAVYNKTKPAEKVTEFGSRMSGAERVWERLQSIPYSKPISAEDKDTTKAAKAAERARVKEEKTAAKTVDTSEPKSRSSSVLGEAKPVREGSSLATIIRLMDGTRTFEQIANESRIEPGVLGVLSKVTHRIKFVLKVSHGVGHSVDSNGLVSVVLPEGHTLDTIIAASPEMKKAA